MCLLDLFQWVGTATISEFLEQFYGLYWGMLREKEEEFWSEASAAYLRICLVEVAKWKCGTVEQVLVGGLLWLGGISW